MDAAYGKKLGVLLVATGLFAGCFSDLGGVKIDRDGGTGADLASGGGGGDCDLPYLLVMVRDFRGTSGLVKHGSVLRIPLDGRDPCTPLTLGESLDPDPTVVGFWPPSTVVYGEADGRLRFIAPDDSEAQAPYSPGVTQSPDYIFSLLDEDDVPHLAIGYDYTNDPMAPLLARVDVLGPTNLSQRVARWEMGVSDTSELLRVEGVVGIDTDPRDAHRMLVFQDRSPDDPTQALVGPWNGQPSLPEAFLDSQSPDDRPRLMRARRDGDNERYVWIFSPAGSSFGDERIVHRSQKAGSAPKQWGPLACTNTTMCTEPMLFSDAIPDFTDETSVIATCYVETSAVTGASTANVIRIRSNGQCDTLFRGDTLPELHHLLGLAVAR